MLLLHIGNMINASSINFGLSVSYPGNTNLPGVGLGTSYSMYPGSQGNPYWQYHYMLVASTIPGLFSMPGIVTTPLDAPFQSGTMLYINKIELFRVRGENNEAIRPSTKDVEVGQDAFFEGAATVAFASSLRGGAPGKALLLNNIDTVQSVPMNAAQRLTFGPGSRLFSLSDWTVEFWFDRNGNGIGTSPALFSLVHATVPTSSNVLLRYLTDQHSLEMWCGVQSMLLVMSPQTGPFHVVVTNKAGLLEIAVNGVNQGSNIACAAFPPSLGEFSRFHFSIYFPIFFVPFVSFVSLLNLTLLVLLRDPNRRAHIWRGRPRYRHPRLVLGCAHCSR